MVRSRINHAVWAMRPILVAAATIGGPASAQDIIVVPGVTILETLPGQNAAQRSMARSIDAVCPTLATNVGVLDPAGQDLARVCTSMIDTAVGGPTSYGLNNEELNNALQSINGEEIQAPTAQINDARGGQTTNLLGRLSSLRAGAAGPLSFGNLRLDTGDRILIASNDPDFAPSDISSVSDRWGVFLSGGFAFGDRDETSELDSFDFTTFNVTTGVDYRLTDQVIVGLGVGYSRFDTDFDSTSDSPSGQDLNSNSYSVSLYGTYYPADAVYVDAVATVGYSDYDSKRRIVIPSTTAQPSENRTANGDFDGIYYGATITGGYDWTLTNGLTITPSVGLDYQRAEIDDFEESGASGLNLAFDDQDAESFRSSLGLQITYPISLNFGVLIPTASASWIHDFIDDDDGVRFSYANDPTGLSSFRLDALKTDQDYGIVGGGLALALPQGFSVFTEYNTVVWLEDYSIHTIVAGLRKSF